MARSLTVADLVDRLDLPVVLTGPTDAQVAGVRIVDGLDALHLVEPATAVVLTGAVAAEPWSVDLAVRIAWERAASCVVVTSADAHTEATGALAVRLSIAVLSVDAAPLDAAVRVATIVAADEASAAGTLSAAARAFGTAAITPKRAIATLQKTLPALRFALVDARGTTIAGTQGAAPLLEVAVPFPYRAGAARLFAYAERAGQAGVVAEQVMRLAVPPLTAWAALRRLDDLRSTAASAEVMRELIAADGAPGGRLRAALAAQGWPIAGPWRFLALLPAPGADAESFGSAVLRAGSSHRAVAGAAPFRDAWVLVLPESRARSEGQLAALVDALVTGEEQLAHATAGVSAVVAEGEPLVNALDAALAAAKVARAGTDRVLFGDRIGPAAALPALLPDGALDAARAALGPLLEADRDGTLLLTLTVALDHSDRPAVVASVLGVHRNTVAARLERVRSLGIDPGDPQQRLAIHIAARRLLDARGQAAGSP
ncbi:helix-turn-helix domain-containing protein [Agromyces italicus]|uniref:helix-turn-helix domain-containing protein n=1 Tax=Agromyces italicus TaxID=279572 RepID=UPI0003B47E6E|nr:helix-turn-helix domain-containing protein [Agromyces italicus]